MARDIDRQPIWVREWIEHLRQQLIKRQFPGFRPRVKVVDRPSPEMIFGLPVWVQDEIDELEWELCEP